jgi:hypothetical protein
MIQQAQIAARYCAGLLCVPASHEEEEANDTHAGGEEEADGKRVGTDHADEDAQEQHADGSGKQDTSLSLEW